MDGENNGKPYEQMDDLGGVPIIFGSTHIFIRGLKDLFPNKKMLQCSEVSSLRLTIRP